MRPGRLEMSHLESSSELQFVERLRNRLYKQSYLLRCHSTTNAHPANLPAKKHRQLSIAKMKTVFIFLAFVAIATAHRGNSSPEERACWDAIRTEGGRDEIKGYFDTCIAQQSGLQAIIDTLKPKRPEGDQATGTSSTEGPGGQGGRRGPPGGRDGRHGGRGNPVALLRENGYTSEVAVLLKCVAQEQGYLDASGNFNIQDYKNKLIASVTAAGKQSEVQRGIDNCPTDALTAYDVKEYMRCVISYCATGAAPTN
ncbi:uncharacterized protein LOC108674692 isoform X2 [Hyalella azteca]|uniref:Uncharacterized protein LOC108674692 isoform X2 n=1 Tax=Hyalella azteca TaxID=294128 RepID=A0A8B7NWI0_HYAAZ|nr:uncharacterized protein LOC108674692 isoform X2 [Hyalella azteca]